MLGGIAAVLECSYWGDLRHIAKIWTTTVHETSCKTAQRKARESEVQEPIHNVCLTLAPCLECRHKLRTSDLEIQGNQ